MGKSVQNISSNVSLIASTNTWIEGQAIQQLSKTAELTGMKHVVGMPDLHPGRGYPIGAAFFSTNKVYPALVGSDIGCGMALWQTDLKLQKLKVEKLIKRLNAVETPLDDSWQSLIKQRKIEKSIVNDSFDHALGTIGGGNHFAEFQGFEEVFDSAAIDELALDTSKLVLLVHSGSRGLGQAILQSYIGQFNHCGLTSESAELAAYLKQHDQAVRWAELNRELIAKRFLAAINSAGDCKLDVNHNLVTAKSAQGLSGWLHRKGATPSDCGYVIIPGSRGDYSYLVKPVTGAIAQSSLFSLAHGAGRKWRRGECHDRLRHKYHKQDLYRTSLGSRVICGNKELLYDEAPEAYKSCQSVISDMLDAGLITLVAKLRPVLTFKTHGDCAG